MEKSNYQSQIITEISATSAYKHPIKILNHCGNFCFHKIKEEIPNLCNRLITMFDIFTNSILYLFYTDRYTIMIAILLNLYKF